MVLAKMKVTSVTKTEYPGETVKFYCQYSNNPEDNSFSEATPQGNMELVISNPSILGFFAPGDIVYIKIAKVNER